MKKEAWKIHAVLECENCGKIFDNYKNAQGIAAIHAKKYGHKVVGEIGICVVYDGSSENISREPK